jgi:hypothetical protein
MFDPPNAKVTFPQKFKVELQAIIWAAVGTEAAADICQRQVNLSEENP